MRLRRPSIPYIIWMVIFTIIPIFLIGFYAFTDRNGNFSLQPFTKIDSKCIIDLKVKHEIIKHVENNMGENLDDLECGDDFLDATPKA